MSIPCIDELSERRSAGFAGADANGLFERQDEDLAVADLAGLAGDCWIVSITLSAMASSTASSSFTLGTKLTVYSAPR